MPTWCLQDSKHGSSTCMQESVATASNLSKGRELDDEEWRENLIETMGQFTRFICGILK